LASEVDPARRADLEREREREAARDPIGRSMLRPVAGVVGAWLGKLRGEER